MNKITLAGCIILDKKGRLLLIHRNTSKRTQWETPGGKIDPGEKPLQTAEREAEEELGVDIEIVRQLGRKEFKEDGHTMDYIWYLVKIKSGTPKIVEKDKYDRLSYFTWIKLKTIQKQLSPNTRNLVTAYWANELLL